MKKITELYGDINIPIGKKTIRIMKLTSLFLMLSVVSVFASKSYSQTKLINLSAEQTTVKDILSKIEDQSEFYFMYSGKVIDADRQVSVKADNQKIDALLDAMFAGTDVDYTIRDRIIVLTTPEIFSSESLVAFQQPAVSGTVTDESGEPLPGVTVVVKGTTQGTVTNADGNYSLSNISENATLVFSYVGMITREIEVGNQTTIDVTLETDAIGIEEVVAIGYGTVKKSDLTGAIGSVSQEELERIPAANFEQALQGRVAGVQVTTNSGRPGGDVSIRIRGVGTINNNDPLYVIDGIPVYTSNSGFGNPISIINPNDIQSIEILKDASAAIYGARAANGVIIITTKRGEIGKATLSYDGYYGFQEISNKYDVLNAEEYALFTNEMRSAQKVAPLTPEWIDPANIPGNANTDWQDEILRSAPMQNHSLSFSGGGNGIIYSISGNYMDQDGIIKGSDFKRYSIRANTDADISEKLKIGTSILYSQTNESLEGNGNILTQAIRQLPTIPVKFQDGSWGGPPGIKEFYNDISNPVALIELNDNNRVNNRFLGNLYLEFEILEGLELRPSYSVDNLTGKSKSFNPEWVFGEIFKPSNDLNISNRNEIIQTFETTISYDKIINEIHKISAVGIYSVQESKFEIESQSTNNLLSTDIPYMDASTGDIDANGSASEWAIISYTGRMNYSLLDRYLLSATVRRDGSSRFGEKNRWAIFPAFSVGWRLGDESFLNQFEVISDLKLRASWGQSGNQEIGLYGFVGNLSNEQRYVLGQNQDIVPGVAPISLANPDLKWETTTQTNIGLDAGLLENRIELSVNYYIKNTDDMLVRVPVPNHSGITVFPFVNASSMENKGWEFNLGVQNSIGNFNYKLSGNLAFNENKLTSLGTGEEIISGSFAGQNQVGGQNVTITREGDPVGSFYGWLTDGIFQNQAEVEAHASQLSNTRPGDLRFQDLNEDGVIDGLDRTIIGSPLPSVIYGFNANLGYQAFDISLFFQGIGGNEIYNGVRAIYGGSTVDQNYLKEVLNRWRGEGTSNEYPRAILRDLPENNRVSNRWIEDGSFLRLKNLTIGYKLPNQVLESLNVDKLRVYLAGTNLLTFTNYSGIDPEIGENNNSVLFSGIDQRIYPVARTYTFGLNLTF